MITVLEFFGGCIFVIMRVSRIILGFGGFAEKMIFMLLHFVVLPYAFLMNTRYNKKRIIEEGWVNVFKNMVISNNCKVAICLIKEVSDPNVNGGKPGPDNICWMDQREPADLVEATCSGAFGAIEPFELRGSGSTSLNMMSLASGTTMSNSLATMALSTFFSAVFLVNAMV